MRLNKVSVGVKLNRTEEVVYRKLQTLVIKAGGSPMTNNLQIL